MFLFLEETFGLFRWCNGSDCEAFPYKVDDEVKAIRAFMCLSIIMSIIAIICAIVYMATDKIHPSIISVILVFTFVFALIGLAVFTDMKNKRWHTSEFGWAYALGWVGAALALINSTIIMISMHHE